MNDQELRAHYGRFPVPEFLQPAFNAPPPLAEATVAIVTTAGLMVAGQPWETSPASFRTFVHAQAGLIVGHPSAGFDRVASAADLNIVYPVERLDELVAKAVIKAAAPRHISFMGGINDLTGVLLDSGPAAAKQLKDDGVDVVILVPVCPMCPRLANALAHVMEQAGLCTVVLASNLDFAQRMRPPRALFCDFPIGRPLGKPRDPAFQCAVLRAGLELLQRTEGPVLEIYPITIGGEAAEALVCSVPPSYDPELPPAVAEARAIRPAWDRTRAGNKGATQIGRSVTVEQVPAAVGRFVKLSEGMGWREAGFSSERDISNQAMDIRVFYEEASISLADHIPAARAADEWFYASTSAGKLMGDVFAQLHTSDSDLSAEVFLTFIPMHRPEFAERFRDDFPQLLSRATMMEASESKSNV